MKRPKVNLALIWGIIIAIWVIVILSYVVYMNTPNS